MAISFRSTPKRIPRDDSADAILSRQDFEDAVAAVNMTLADIAKQTDINRQYLSEFKSGTRNLRAEMRQTLREFFEAKGVEFVATEPDDDAAQETLPTRAASAEVLVFPRPAFTLNIAADLPAADREAALSELDAIVRENDRLLLIEMEYASFSLNASALSGGAAAINEELRQGLTYEALLRRVLAGSFKARHAEGQAATHADLIAQQLLQRLPAGEPTDPEPLVESSPEHSVAEAAAAGTAGGEGPSTVAND